MLGVCERQPAVKLAATLLQESELSRTSRLDAPRMVTIHHVPNALPLLARVDLERLIHSSASVHRLHAPKRDEHRLSAAEEWRRHVSRCGVLSTHVVRVGRLGTR